MEFQAQLLRIHQETPTVKSFLLRVGSEGFTFLPGQWIDLCVDTDGGERAVGGFTLVSSPLRRGVIELAIKGLRGGRAAAHLWNQARVGDIFWISRPSGDFCFHEDMSDSLVLIAGGIGVNPLMSMVRYLDDAGKKVRITLIYSVTSPSELLFGKELQAISARNPLLRCLFTVTQPGQEPWEGRRGRIDKKMLEEAKLDLHARYYICGPPGMPTELARVLRGLGVLPDSIRFEEW